VIVFTFYASFIVFLILSQSFLALYGILYLIICAGLLPSGIFSKYVECVCIFIFQKEHSALLSKLEFISDLVRCVVSVAEERSSPFAQSVISDKSSSGYSDKMFADEVQRCIEQLVLYIRALHLLASGLQLAQCALRDGQLEPSKTASRSQFV